MCRSVRNNQLWAQVNTGCGAETSYQHVGSDWWNGATLAAGRMKPLRRENRIVEAGSNTPCHYTPSAVKHNTRPLRNGDGCFTPYEVTSPQSPRHLFLFHQHLHFCLFMLSPPPQHHRVCSYMSTGIGILHGE